MHKLILRSGREKSLKRRHPWVFSGALARVGGNPAAGDTVEVCSGSGEFLAVAAYSPESQIVARVWDWTRREIDPGFFTERIAQAAHGRQALLDSGATDAARLVHGESDRLPGIVADRYGDTVVMQLTSAGAERWRVAIADALAALPGIARVWERSDADVRMLEGLEPRTGLLRGALPAGEMVIHEHGLRFRVELEHGHKTGFYLDQRDNRQRLRALAKGCDVLDCFCYAGGFALNACAAGAKSVLAIDSAAPALATARANAALNAPAAVEWREADVFAALRQLRDGGRSFDVIVLDPPKFAPTAAHAARASRAYKDINLLAFKLLRPGGALMTFSCSGGVDARIETWLHAAADHPVALNFPEGEYLKGLLCRTAN